MKGRMNNSPEGMNKKAKWEKNEDNSPREVYEGKGSNVEKEADEKKRGGKVHKKHLGKAEGNHSKHRADRKPRMSGGRADKSPLSTAHSAKKPTGRKDLELN